METHPASLAPASLAPANSMALSHASLSLRDGSGFDSHLAATVATASREPALAHRHKSLMIVTWFIAAGLVATMSLVANGQVANYDKIQMHERFSDPAIVRRMDVAAKDFARAREASEVRDPQFAQAYFTLYLPAKITQPDALPEISELTQNVMKLLASAQRNNSQLVPGLIRWLHDGMKRVAEGNYQPAARINALVILGRLDTRPGDATARRAPVPYGPSFLVLRDQYMNESNPEGVRAAALQGLHRFVSFGFPTLRDQDKAPLIAAMQELLDSEVPEGRDRMVHAYLQRFAVDILAVLEPNQGGTLGERLVSISADPSRHNLIALYSLSKLPTLGNYGPAVQDPGEYLGNWSVRAMRAFQYELARLELLDGIPQASKQPPSPESTVTKVEDPTARSPMFGSYDDYGDGDDGGGGDDGGDYADDGDYGGDDGGEYGYRTMAANPQPPEVIASRRKLNHLLQQLQHAVTGSTKAGVPSRPGGLMAAVQDEQKKRQIKTWAESMAALIAEVNNPFHDDRAKFKTALQSQIETIRALAGSAGEQAAAEDEKVPPGLNPYINLARLSGAPLRKSKEAEPVMAPVEEVAPEAPAEGQPSVAAPVPSVDAAAARQTTPAPAGT